MKHKHAHKNVVEVTFAKIQGQVIKRSVTVSLYGERVVGVTKGDQGRPLGESGRLSEKRE